ncbi:hypothetical protein COL940_009062 [Colletotrichum noveboracense]|nr:hypothetical protein COL940_009062 [Colletotrichum noveboracense]
MLILNTRDARHHRPLLGDLALRRQTRQVLHELHDLLEPLLLHLLKGHLLHHLPLKGRRRRRLLLLRDLQDPLGHLDRRLPRRRLLQVHSVPLDLQDRLVLHPLLRHHLRHHLRLHRRRQSLLRWYQAQRAREQQFLSLLPLRLSQ